MTTFKPGDKVTSPLLVGEWEVRTHDDGTVVVVSREGNVAYLFADQTTLAAPPPPPEPPVGSVVWAHGTMYLRTDLNSEHHWTDGEAYFGWPLLATAPDLSPVVAVEDFAEWMDGEGIASPYYLDRLRAEFGGWGDE